MLTKKRVGWALVIGVCVLATIYVGAHGEAITLRASEAQPMTRSPIEPASGSNSVYVLKLGEEVEVIQCEDIKRPVILVRARSGAIGYVDYGAGHFTLDRRRLSLRLLLSAPQRITFSCWGMFREPVISRYSQ